MGVQGILETVKPGYCKCCGSKISWEKRRNKFCNHSCAAIYNNNRKGTGKNKPETNCLNCGKDIGKTWKGKFCCHICDRDYRYKEYIKRWKACKETGNKSNNESLSNHVRRYLFEKYDSKCTRCGWGEVNFFTNNVPLEVEHLDGNASNSVEENLDLICPNCHSLTKTSKGANRGKGRIQRRLRDRKNATVA